MPTLTRAYALDVLERALSTFWQGATGASSVVITAVDVAHVVSAAWWQQVGALALAGGVSAVGSLLKSTYAGVKTGTASTSKTVAAVTAESSGAHAVAAADTAPPVTAPASWPITGLTVAGNTFLPVAPDPDVEAATNAALDRATAIAAGATPQTPAGA